MFVKEWYEKYKVNLPEMRSQDWAITKFTVTEEISLRSLFKHQDRACPPGVYTCLIHRKTGATVMSDTPAEIRDHFKFMFIAHGSVLLAGLGLGVVLQGILKHEEVTDVTVVEKSKELIDMVSPFYPDPRVTYVWSDIFKWQPPKGKVFDFAWFDIWNTISVSNLPEMFALHRKFGKKAKFKDSWGRKLCLRMRREWQQLMKAKKAYINGTDKTILEKMVERENEQTYRTLAKLHKIPYKKFKEQMEESIAKLNSMR